jgi:hypothetical protein
MDRSRRAVPAAVLALLLLLLLVAAAPACARPDPLALVRALHARAASEPLPGPADLTADKRTPPSAQPAVTYYVDALTGDDAGAGTSALTPWRTLARVDAARLRDGDTILLRGGERFAGSLKLGRSDVKISAYGGGRATIAPGAASAIVAVNAPGAAISELVLAGGRRGCDPDGADGVLFDARDVNGTLGRGVTISDVEAYGFCDGIAIGTEDDLSVIAHVRISGVSAHDNGDAGVVVFDPSYRRHDVHDVRVMRTTAYGNAASGGILLFGVERGIVEHSSAFGNGRGNSGAVGIWAFDADRILFTHDESYGNLTVGDDGDGFDLDGGVTNSAMTDDYAHGNQGIGFLICACVGYWYPQHGDQIRGDVSVNDGSSGQTSAIYVGGGAPFSGMRVLGNVAYSRAGRGPLVSLDGALAPYSNVRFEGNAFAAAGARKPLLYYDGRGAGVSFAADRWTACAGRHPIEWGRRAFKTVSAWVAATGVRARRPAPRLCR